MRIGIDLMGSESSPRELFGAVFAVLHLLKPSDSLVVYASNEIFDPPKLIPAKFSNNSHQIDFHPVSETITMEDDPLTSIRLKKGSSLVIGISHIKEKRIDALVTAGNTGALIAAATIMLPLLKGCDRPALLASLPTFKRPLAVVDVGGLLSVRPQQLVQNAYFGAAYQRCRLGLEKAAVGLLNIGTESRKGTAEAREAYRLLQEASQAQKSKIHFVGNVEGREIFQGKTDVLVTDGFTGNVLLKTSEGLSAFILDYLDHELNKRRASELDITLENLQRRFSYEEYPGALVCGVEGILVKCHGAASERGMAKSIEEAIHLVRNGLLAKIKEEL